MKKITIALSDKESDLMDEALKISGLRTKAELIRHITKKYITENSDIKIGGTYAVGTFLNGEDLGDIMTESGFPLRNGGANILHSCAVIVEEYEDDNQVIAIATNMRDAIKITNRLNGGR